MNKLRTVSLCGFLAVTVSVLTGCSNAQKAAISAWGQEALVLKYSGGKLVHAGISTGKVQSEDQSDGWYYSDKCTGHLVEVAGDVVIIRSDKGFECSALPATDASDIRSKKTDQ